MKFGTKRDPFFVYLWVVILLLINVGFVLPPLITGAATDEWIAMLAFDAVTCGFLLWLALDIRYVLGEDALLVRGGMFSSRIPYNQITRITGKPNIWVGYRLLFSRDAIEIHYRTGWTGSVIISPENQKLFIEELLRKNDGIRTENL